MGLGLFSVTSWAVSRAIGGILQLLKHRKSAECRGESVGREVPRPGTKLVSLLRCPGQGWWAVLAAVTPAAAEFHTAGRGTTDGGVQVAGTHSPAALPLLCGCDILAVARVFGTFPLSQESRGQGGTVTCLFWGKGNAVSSVLSSSRGNSSSHCLHEGSWKLLGKRVLFHGPGNSILL